MKHHYFLKFFLGTCFCLLVNTMSAEGLNGTYKFVSSDYSAVSESAYDNSYASEFVFTIEDSDKSNYDARIVDMCGQNVTFYANYNTDKTELTIKTLGYCYFSAVDYKGKGTESMGAKDGTIMGTLAFTQQADGSLAISDFTVINTIINTVPTSTVLAKYNGCTATKIYPVELGTYSFSAEYTAGATSNYGNTYPETFTFSLEQSDSQNYDVMLVGFCGSTYKKFYAKYNADKTAISISNPGNCYFSAVDYKENGTESLGSAAGTIMGAVTFTANAEGSLSVSDFTTISTVISGVPVSTVLATYKNGKATRLYQVQLGTYDFSAEYTAGATSNYGISYPEKFTFSLEQSDSQNYDVMLVGFCGSTYKKFYAKYNADKTSFSISNPGNCYFSAVDYKGNGTESLGSATATIMGAVTFTANADGSLAISDFTVINTVISGIPVSTALATYKNGKAIPSTTALPSVFEDNDRYAANEIYAAEGVVCNPNCVQMQVYALNGQLVYQGNDETVSLAKGIYIVKTTRKAVKVVVK